MGVERGIGGMREGEGLWGGKGREGKGGIRFCEAGVRDCVTVLVKRKKV